MAKKRNPGKAKNKIRSRLVRFICTNQSATVVVCAPPHGLRAVEPRNPPAPLSSDEIFKSAYPGAGGLGRAFATFKHARRVKIIK